MEYLVAAISKVGQLTLKKKEALADEMRCSQPQLLGLGLVASRFGVTPASLESLIHIMLVCYQSMKESPLRWSVITESQVETELARWLGAVQFAAWAGREAEQARKQYLDQHSERPLLAYVLDEINRCLAERPPRSSAAEEDRVFIMAGVTMVNCIASCPIASSPGR